MATPSIQSNSKTLAKALFLSRHSWLSLPHGSGHPHTRLQPPGSPRERIPPSTLAIVVYLSRSNRTNLGIGGPLVNTPWVWFIYSCSFFRNRRREKMKLEGRRIYMRIFPVRKFAQRNYTITANLRVCLVVHGLLEDEILMCLIPRDGNGGCQIPYLIWGP